MTTETATPVAEQTTETSQPKTISDPSLSFTDYQTLRRGGTLTTEETAPASAPTHKSESEHKEASKSGTEETEEKESESLDEAGHEDGETESKEDDKDENKPAKKKGGFQRRIDKLNARTAAAQQEAEYWKREALKNATATKPEAKPETIATQASADGKPNPNDFETHEQWVEAMVDWKADQKLSARDQKAEQKKLLTEHQQMVKTYTDRVDAFAAKAEDFHEVVAEVDDIIASATVLNTLLSSENGPELAYELAKNRAEYARINALPPLAAARELGKFEAKIASKVSSEKKPETKKTTQAPKPIEPVGGGKASAAKKTPEEMSYSEYERYRRDEMKRKGA